MSLQLVGKTGRAFALGPGFLDIPVKLLDFSFKAYFEIIGPCIELFRFLREEAQVTRLQIGIIKNDGEPSFPPEIVTALHAMPQLTPGDFAVVRRKLGLTRIPADAESVLGALSEEHRYKQHLGRAIGFLR